MKRICVAEAVGTFALIWAGTGAIIANDISNGAVTHVGIALTFGLVVMAVIYALGDVSGAHLNPAVTVGFFVSGRLKGSMVVPYLVSQFVGAFAASGCLKLSFPAHPTLGATIPSGTWQQAFVFELLLTALLMFVILCVSTGAKEKGIMAGAAVGAVITFEALFAGPISGASMNPARSLAPAVLCLNLQHQWLYVVAPVLGAISSVPLCKLVHDEGECCPACE